MKTIVAIILALNSLTALAGDNLKCVGGSQNQIQIFLNLGTLKDGKGPANITVGSQRFLGSYQVSPSDAGPHGVVGSKVIGAWAEFGRTDGEKYIVTQTELYLSCISLN